MSAVPPMPFGATVAGAAAFNAPFHMLAPLPRELWLPAIVWGLLVFSAISDGTKS
jgi:hypothetical protein